jgi:hypothetical protein
MKIEKFQFIELPRPEITISASGTSHILGGVLCEIKYTQCIGNKETTCSLDSHLNGFNKDSDCHGSTTGSSFCAEHSATCKNYIIP